MKMKLILIITVLSFCTVGKSQEVTDTIRIEIDTVSDSSSGFKLYYFYRNTIYTDEYSKYEIYKNDSTLIEVGKVVKLNQYNIDLIENDDGTIEWSTILNNKYYCEVISFNDDGGLKSLGNQYTMLNEEKEEFLLKDGKWIYFNDRGAIDKFEYWNIGKLDSTRVFQVK